MSLTAWRGVLQSLSGCEHIIHLNLSFSIHGEAAQTLAQSIRSLGDEPPLQTLRLWNGSLTATASLELVQSLATCKHLTVLSLNGNKLGEAGHQLAQSIRCWGDEPPLKKLHLVKCLLTTTASLELVQSLATCKHLTVLSLNGNKLGEAGHQLAQTIRSWGDEPLLRMLYLRNCSIPVSATFDLVQSLLKCKHLEILDLEGNEFNDRGYHLAQSIRSSLKSLYLPDLTSMTAVQCEPPVVGLQKDVQVHERLYHDNILGDVVQVFRSLVSHSELRTVQPVMQHSSLQYLDQHLPERTRATVVQNDLDDRGYRL